MTSISVKQLNWGKGTPLCEWCAPGVPIGTGGAVLVLPLSPLGERYNYPFRARLRRATLPSLRN